MKKARNHVICRLLTVFDTVTSRGGGIRTPGPRKGSPVFKTGAINHSTTPLKTKSRLKGCVWGCKSIFFRHFSKTAMKKSGPTTPVNHYQPVKTHQSSIRPAVPIRSAVSLILSLGAAPRLLFSFLILPLVSLELWHPIPISSTRRRCALRALMRINTTSCCREHARQYHDVKKQLHEQVNQCLD